MSGPVTEIQDWRLRSAWALGLGVLAAVWFGRRLTNFQACVTLGVATQILAWLLVTTWFHDIAVSYRPWRYCWLVLRVGLPSLLALSMASQCGAWLRDPASALQGAPTALSGKTGGVGGGPFLLAASAFYAVGWTALLLFDGRYRDIPEIDFAVPVGGLLVMLALRMVLVHRQGGNIKQALLADGLFVGRRTVGAALLAWCMPISALMALASEGLALIGRDFIRDHPELADQITYILHGLVWNREMDLWAVMLVAWAVPYILSRRIAAPAAATRVSRNRNAGISAEFQ